MDIRITTFNIEWMVSVFGGRWADWDGTIPDAFPGRRLGDITLEPVPDMPALIARITGVIDAIDPDILCVQEGPPRRDQMEAFVDRHLGGRFGVVTANSQWQTNHVLIRKGLPLDHTADDPKDRATTLRWSGGPWYPWGLVAAEARKLQRYHRQPVRLMLTPDAADPDAPRLELISLHTKSKFSKLRTRQQWERRETAAVLDALNVRQKLSAEIALLRRHIEAQIDAEGSDHAILVLGDLNDGPAADLLEGEFLLHNIIDQLLGTILSPQTRMRHAMSDDVLATSATTRFHNPLADGELTEELIDHMLISDGLATGRAGVLFRPGSCAVDRPAWEAQNEEADDQDIRQLRPSDHLPVSGIVAF
ncbi:endonuclease/exonuclease/phosphatase family protein [Roseicyclus mahoneyensis]|uniref:Endonuclease/exonuclease/phosphatase family protein n=1 Tax=Roseicyclus mahoneyensis TaxID=164332 RepID=A0A316GMT2_9RHOB|nr:endonuclease/exonuclease/phosphatase family protein [Roseicyclus mahoneyensis]PWK62109.1 endonuclease/exonuclease/phosphatase family protein [Roseicyclus mahoneyensis]